MIDIRSPRDAGELDSLIDAVCEAFGDMRPDDWRFDAVREAFPATPELCLGAWDRDRPVGAVLGFPNPDGSVRARILGVLEEVRGTGTASALMRALQAAAEHGGRPAIDLGTQDARGFYERLGYRCTDVLDGPEHVVPTYVMQLDLTAPKALAED